MDSPFRPGLLNDGRFARLVGIGVLALSVGVLIGWALDITFLKNVLPGQVSMKANTAVGLALVALALGLTEQRAGRFWPDRISIICALAAAVLGAATLIQYVLKTNLGLDELLFRDSFNAVATSHPGRMAPLTAVDLVLLGVSLWLVRRPRTVLVAQALAVLVGFNALFSLIGYVYHVSQFYQLAQFTAMAVHTSGAFLVLGLGVLALRSDAGLMRALFRYGSGGRIMGWLLASVVVVPMALSWLKLQGEVAGLYDANVGGGLMTISLIGFLIVGIWWASLLLGRADEERQQVELALRAGEARLNFVLQTIHAGGWELDPGSRTILCTPEYHRIFGYDTRQPEWTYPMFLEHVLPEDRARVDRSFQAAADAGTDLNFECRIRRADGVERWIWVVARNQEDTSGERRRMVGTVQDIAEHKRTEAAMRQVNEQKQVYETLRSTIELMPNCIYLKDKNCRFLMANRGLARLFGMDSSAQLVGLGDQDLFAPEIAAVFRADEETVLAGREVREQEEIVTFPSGLTRTFLTTKIPFRDARGEIIGILGTSIDITERKQAEVERQQFESKLQETQKLESLGVLAGGIAHDFNNLLTGILGNASLARMETSATSPLLPNLAQIEESAHRAAELCRQMLAYAGKGRFVVQRLDLNKLIDGTTRLLSITISKKCVLRFNLAPKLPAIAADATQIRQIIMNLVINASEAIGPRSGVIALSTGVVRVDADYLATLLYSEKISLGDYVFVEVSDNGSGMEAAVVGKIFDPFFTTKFTGRGLGLAAVLGIVRGHKGSLKVYSEPGRGTTFKILLPCVEGAPDETMAGLPDAGERWRGQGTVLIVDDEETVRTVAARILESLGFTVVLAADGSEAVEKYRGEPARFSLVLLDLTMPHMDGEETFRQLRHLNPGVKVVLMSGFNQVEAISRFTGKGLAGFVQKPFEVNDVVTAIQAVFMQT